MKQWFTLSEIAAAAGSDLPRTVRGLGKIADRQHWRQRTRKGRGGGLEYHVASFPPAVQARLSVVHAAEQPATTCNELWARFEALSKRQKTVCETRLNAVLEADRLARGGLTKTAAMRRAARTAGVAVSSLFEWKAKLKGVARCDWLAALAPAHKGRQGRDECHGDAYAAFKSDYLRAEAPAFTACYRRMTNAARREGWSPIPSERSLRRHLDADVPRAVQVLAREGRDKARTLYPAQRRSRAHFHAMQAVNADGHKLDVFVRLDDGSISRVFLVALQDLHSGMIVGHRLAETENKVAIRLAIGDMIERHGVPELCWLDNGRGFASKWITGGTANRYRFKVRDGDPQGLLTTLGVEIRWTQPYSGQSKPIERAFRDLAEEIGKHPFCAGAYTGNKPDAKPENYGEAAIPIEEFREFVAARIAEHNDRPGRRTEAAKGRSFRATFEASLAEPGTVVGWPTQAQRSLWLLAAEKIRARKGSGEIHLFGNRYWSPELNAFAGKELVVRFDPDRLAEAIKVHDLEDSLICEAACLGDVRFDSVDDARQHAARRGAFMKNQQEQLRLHRELSAEQLTSLYAEIEGPAQERPARPRVQRIVTGRSGAQPKPETDPDVEWDRQADAEFSRGCG